MNRRDFLKGACGAAIACGAVGVLPRSAQAAVSLDHLLQGRRIVESYQQAKCSHSKGKEKKNNLKLIRDLKSDLKALGFDSISDFYEANKAMCLDELDRCFDIRRKDGPAGIDLCDGCIGRAQPEKNFCCAAMNVKMGKPTNMPVHEGRIYRRQEILYMEMMAMDQERANQVLVLANALALVWFWLFPGHTSEACIGQYIQIAPENFDYLWGMEMYMVKP